MGYFLLHGPKPQPTIYLLDQTKLEELPQLLAKHPKLWLSIYGAVPWFAGYPAEGWLDERAYVGAKWWFDESRLLVYAGGPQVEAMPSPALFGESISLVASGAAPKAVRAWEPLAVRLVWQARGAIDDDLTLFLHLLDEKGQIAANADALPQGGLRPPKTWGPGEIIEDRRRLLLPASMAPGRYELILGWYRPEDRWRLPVSRPGVELKDSYRLGPVEVLAQQANSVPIASRP